MLSRFLFLWRKWSTSTNVHIFALILSILTVAATPASAQVKGWDFYFFGVNAKLFKDADYKMVALGAVTSLAVHTAGHYLYAAANDMHIRQDGLNEVISLDDHSPRKIREFMMAGFALQHAVGVALTTIPATRQTDFTRGYVAMAWLETLSYPLRNGRGDFYWSDKYGGNYELEYSAFSFIATHNVLRVKWYKD